MQRVYSLACHRNHAVRFLFNLAVQTSWFAQRFAFFQLCIYSKWMTELQQGTENQFLPSPSLFVCYFESDSKQFSQLKANTIQRGYAKIS